MKFKLSCTKWDSSHIWFNVFDATGANCGTITVLTDDVIDFVSKNWNGDVTWNGIFTASSDSNREVLP